MNIILKILTILTSVGWKVLSNMFGNQMPSLLEDQSSFSWLVLTND